jgi:hypothetical protein
VVVPCFLVGFGYNKCIWNKTTTPSGMHGELGVFPFKTGAGRPGAQSSLQFLISIWLLCMYISSWYSVGWPSSPYLFRAVRYDIHICLTSCFQVCNDPLFLVFFHWNPSSFTTFLKLVLPSLKWIIFLNFGRSLEMIGGLFFHVEFMNHVKWHTYQNHLCLLDILTLCSFCLVYWMKFFALHTYSAPLKLFHLHFGNFSCLFCPNLDFQQLFCLMFRHQCFLLLCFFVHIIAYIQNSFLHLFLLFSSKNPVFIVLVV